MTSSHTCPVCRSQLHAAGNLVAWITTDGRVILELASPSPTAQRWLEMTAGSQNWLAEILRQARDTAQAYRPTEINAAGASPKPGPDRKVRQFVHLDDSQLDLDDE